MLFLLTHSIILINVIIPTTKKESGVLKNLKLKRLLLSICGINIMHKLISEKAMAPHSSTLAWKIPWTEESGRLQSMGSQRVGHD